MATADGERTARTWSVTSGEQILEIDAASHGGDSPGVTGMVFSPDDQTLVTSDGPVVSQWSTSDGQAVQDDFTLFEESPALDSKIEVFPQRLTIDPSPARSGDRRRLGGYQVL